MMLWYVNITPTNNESRCCSSTDAVVLSSDNILLWEYLYNEIESSVLTQNQEGTFEEGTVQKLDSRKPGRTDTYNDRREQEICEFSVKTLQKQATWKIYNSGLNN